MVSFITVNVPLSQKIKENQKLNVKHQSRFLLTVMVIMVLKGHRHSPKYCLQKKVILKYKQEYTNSEV